MLTDTLALDAAHPTLDHHRPGGGAPLFGTVMSLEALGAAARRLGVAPQDFVFEDVEILHPYILADGATHLLTLRFVQIKDGTAGEVLSLEPAPGASHLRAQLRPAETRTEPYAAPSPPLGPAVQAADIYAVFFHGPTFRVVGEARFRNGVLQARLAGHAALGDLPVSARLLEFALQSAGLLEVATSDRMMIPHRIGLITPGRSDPADAEGPIFAHPRFGAAGAIDIAVTDSAGHVVLAVERYQTTPLPFAFDTEAVRRLGAKLRG